jgi:hypothetical protein
MIRTVRMSKRVFGIRILAMFLRATHRRSPQRSRYSHHRLRRRWRRLSNDRQLCQKPSQLLYPRSKTPRRSRRPISTPRGAVGQPSQAPRLPEPIVPVVAKSPGLDLSAAERTDQVKTGTPFYGTWWFWTGVGAAVVAGTVTAIIVAQSGGNGNKATTALGTQAVFQ